MAYWDYDVVLLPGCELPGKPMFSHCYHINHWTIVFISQMLSLEVNTSEKVFESLNELRPEIIRY